jgi:mono/diheme cytochrome c family protein
MRRQAVLFLLVLALALLGTAAAAGCGGGEEVAPTAATVEGPLPAETGEATETSGGTDTGGGGGGGAEGDPAAGKAVFASAGCGGCHTLADAGSSGNVGPNLDDAQPDMALVVERVTNGAGAMPAFKDQLSAEEINNVAAYVSQAAGG